MYNSLIRTTAISVGVTAFAVVGSLLAGGGVLHAESGRMAALVAATPKATPTANAAAAATPEAPATAAPASGDKQRPADWGKESHSNDVDPNYDVVFPIDAVETLTITIAPDDWAAMQADMADIYAPSLPIREALLDAGPGLTEEERLDVVKKVMGEMAAARAAADAATLTATAQLTGAVNAPVEAKVAPGQRSPIWVPATISFKNQVWTHVGVRYKGVSSLGGWVMAEQNLPFKFDFDEFEDDYPEIKNQRFFGFKQLSLANNFGDPAGMRDTLVYDLLEEAGLPSLKTAPYEIVLDYGDGPIPLGLYTLIEVIDDTGVPTYFGSDDGNIYEGDGPGATFSTTYADDIPTNLEKKNNEDDSDWSDIWALYNVLHDNRRTTDPTAWRADLEAIFDVDTFLAWIGISAIVGHGDVFGSNMAHNYYLYNNPDTGQLTWYSWDHNFTFKKGILSNVTLDKPEVNDATPLTSYLLNDPVYFARYKEQLARNFAGAAAPEAIIDKVNVYADLIAPYAAAQMTPEEYDEAVQEIIDFVQSRTTDIEDFLAKQ